MKKLTLTLLLALSLTVVLAQTITKSSISPSGDTTTAVVTTTPSVLNYATLNQGTVTLTNGGLPLSITAASLNQATMTQGTTTVQLFFKPYKAPGTIIPPVTIPPVGGVVFIGGKTSGPITLQSYTTYIGYTIDLGSSSNNGFTGNGVTNVVLKKCKVINGAIINGAISTGVFLSNCNNITIDSCFFSMLPQGVLAKNCGANIKTTDCQFSNIVGSPLLTLHPIAYQNCSGGGLWIINNRIQEDPLISPYTHDQISVFQSYGLKGDSLLVLNNIISGGQQLKNAKADNGAAGITLGDVGGSYQAARGNILVNALAILVDGTGTNLKADHNKIYASQVPPQLPGVGIVYINVNSNNFVGYNRVNFKLPNGTIFNLNPATSSTIQGWGTNVYDSSLSIALLPVPLITFK